jgi:hypothetical protein
MLRRALRLVALLCAAACAGGGSGPPPDVEGFTASEVDFGTVRLAWLPRSGVADGYELDGRAGGGPWQSIATPATLPGTAAGANVTTAADTPELTALSFRIRRVRSGTPGSYAQTDLLHGVHPAADVAAHAAELPSGSGVPTRVTPVTVSWTNASRVATALHLERAIATSALADRDWVALPVAFGATSYADDDVRDDVSYLYRVRYGAGDVLAAPALSPVVAVDLALPTRLTITAIAGGYRVSWVNHSAAATNVVVTRAPAPQAPPVATFLLPSADHLDDLAPSFFPTTRYAVTIQRGAPSFASARGPVAGLPEPPTVAGALPLAAAIALLPGSVHVARDAAGQFHLAGIGAQGLAVHRPTGSTWDTHTEAPLTAIVHPGVAVDGGRHPHVLFTRGSSSPDAHVWHDGAAWQVEDLPSASCASDAFGVSDDGRVHLLCHDVQSGAVTYRVRDGAWSAPETPAVGTVQSFEPVASAFAVARDGTAYLLRGGMGGPDAARSLFVVLLQRSPAGTWTELSRQVTPVTLPRGQIFLTSVWVLPRASGHAAFLYVVPGDRLELVDVGAAGLGAPEVVLEGAPASMTALNLAPAMTDDGARAHVIYARGSTGDPLTLRVRTPTGWQDEAFSPAPLSPVMTGYDASGKAWAIASFDGFDSGALTEHALYAEP